MGELTAFPVVLAVGLCIYGASSLLIGGKGKVGEGKKRGGERRWREGFGIPKKLGIAPPIPKV